MYRWLLLLALLGALSGAQAQPGDFAKSKKKYAEKFTFEQAPGEVVLRTGFHYVVSRTSAGAYLLRVFHPEKGVLNTTATFADEALTRKHGPYIDRYDDGSVYEEGAFEQGRRSGPWKKCTGAKWGCNSGNYVNGLKTGRWLNPDGVSWMTYENGLPHGPFVVVDSLGPDTGYFERGKLVKPITRKRQHQWYPSLGDCDRSVPEGWHDDYADLDTCSQRVLQGHLKTTIRYPAEALDEDIQGVALVEFVVGADGAVAEAHCVKGICTSIEAESIRAMRASPKWNIAEQGGKAVKVRFVQPISFKLR